MRGKAAKIREKRDGIEGYGDGILSTPEKEVVIEAPVAEVVAVSEPVTVDVVAEVPAQDVTTEEVVEPQAPAAEDKPAN